MIVLGIDPGLARLGYGIIQSSSGRLAYIDAGVLVTSPSQETPERLLALSQQLTQRCAKPLPDRMILERLVPGPKRNLGRVAEVRGIILLFAGTYRIPVFEVSPKAVKLLATRFGSAGKLQVQKTVQRVLGIPALPLPDAADALALAISGTSRLTALS